MNLKSLSGVDAPALDETRHQLLEAAGEVFAEVGFHNATVREICRRAGANVAAVNYHFGDKEALYVEVLRHTQQKAFAKYPPLLGVPPDAPAEEKLSAFVRSFLLRIFDEGSIAWFGKMMSREMVEPTAALDSLVAERLQPMADLLRGLVAQILGRPAQDEAVRLCCFSIVSQCVFYHHCRTMISRLFPEQKLDMSAVEILAGHIARFSLAAMKHWPDPETRRSRKDSATRRRR
jgi:AcrR family transcriptional regulator